MSHKMMVMMMILSLLQLLGTDWVKCRQWEWSMTMMQKKLLGCVERNADVQRKLHNTQFNYHIHTDRQTGRRIHTCSSRQKMLSNTGILFWRWLVTWSKGHWT